VFANSYNSCFQHPKCQHHTDMHADTNVPAGTWKYSHTLIRLLENLVHSYQIYDFKDMLLLIHHINMHISITSLFPWTTEHKHRSFSVSEDMPAGLMSHYLPGITPISYVTSKQWLDSCRGATTGGNHGTLSKCCQMTWLDGYFWAPPSIFTCLDSKSKPAIQTGEQQCLTFSVWHFHIWWIFVSRQIDLPMPLPSCIKNAMFSEESRPFFGYKKGTRCHISQIDCLI